MRKGKLLSARETTKRKGCYCWVKIRAAEVERGLKRRKTRNTRTSALQLGEICSLIISFVFTIYSNGIVHILRAIDPLLPLTIFSACANFILPPLSSLCTQKNENTLPIRTNPSMKIPFLESYIAQKENYCTIVD